MTRVGLSNCVFKKKKRNTNSRMETSAEAFWKQFETFGLGAVNEPQLLKAADVFWKMATALEPNQQPVPGFSQPSRAIEVGRNVLSESEKWALQAKVRRSGGYNKKVTRATKQTKGPTPGEGFPPGRGKPVA